MAKIKSSNTEPELILRKALWFRGVRYRINDKTLPGKPDIVIRRYKLVVFVDGEFWHGYNWPEKKKRIKENKNYWIKKIERNIKRDIKNNKMLEEKGFVVLRFWGNEIRKDLETCIHKITMFIENYNSLK